MIAEDLVVLGDAVAGALLEPVGEALVEGRTLCLREGLVCGVADENVSEPERGLVGEVRRCRPDELAVDEAVQAVVETGPLVRVGQCSYRPAVEHLPLDSAMLERRTLTGLYSIEAGAEQLAERRRDRELGQAVRRDP